MMSVMLLNLPPLWVVIVMALALCGIMITSGLRFVVSGLKSVPTICADSFEHEGLIHVCHLPKGHERQGTRLHSSGIIVWD